MFQRIDRDSAKGYTLYDLGSHWELHGPLGIFRGNLKQVMTYAVIELGFVFEELEIGVIEMDKHFHDGAEYGIWKRFMWTFDRSEKIKTTAS
jgi:hypothetical protein